MFSYPASRGTILWSYVIGTCNWTNDTLTDLLPSNNSVMNKRSLACYRDPLESWMLFEYTENEKK